MLIYLKTIGQLMPSALHYNDGILHTRFYRRNTITHTLFGRCEYVCKCPERGFLRRKKQSPCELQTEAPGHAGFWGLGYWKAKQGERKPGESKITLLCPDMTVNWAGGSGSARCLVVDIPNCSVRGQKTMWRFSRNLGRESFVPSMHFVSFTF